MICESARSLVAYAGDASLAGIARERGGILMLVTLGSDYGRLVLKSGRMESVPVTNAQRVC